MEASDSAKKIQKPSSENELRSDSRKSSETKPKESSSQNFDGRANDQGDNNEKDLTFLSLISKIQGEIDMLKNLYVCGKGEGLTASRIRKASDHNILISNKADTELAIHKKVMESQKHEINQSSMFYRIVLTGGPCAGKTTAIAHLSDQLKERGFQVLNVPEAASMIFGSGAKITLQHYSDANKIRFQYYLLLLQMMMEDIFCGIASTTQSEKVVVIMDRGLMDGSAYLGADLWQMMLNEYDLSETRLRDQRYDMVIHMCTAADGAEEFYNLDSNVARYETVSEAVAIDQKLVKAWIGHPNYVYIANSTQKGFKAKLDLVLWNAFKFLGLPLSIKFFNKYIVSNPDKRLVKLLEERYKLDVNEFEIEDYIVHNSQNNEFISYRKRVC